MSSLWQQNPCFVFLFAHLFHTDAKEPRLSRKAKSITFCGVDSWKQAYTSLEWAFRNFLLQPDGKFTFYHFEQKINTFPLMQRNKYIWWILHVIQQNHQLGGKASQGKLFPCLLIQNIETGLLLSTLRWWDQIHTFIKIFFLIFAFTSATCWKGQACRHAVIQYLTWQLQSCL
jgi:hypothetical protein